ncbi:unnamed protein product [Rotaria socialis]|uniref:protein-disulfide reductase n=1 Tax=Rotaria socialis TaxID=392032 RepID=A0A820IGM4_9BILA|nr:unnamed protein product [Rotaria socialis]CAF4307106.1 unnamed protein product [Rotaria socialis]
MKKAQENALHISIVFVSSDFDDPSVNEYRSKMSWPAVPFHSVHLINTYFQSSCIPRLFILPSDGKTLSRRGVDDVSRKGVQSLKTWTQRETCLLLQKRIFYGEMSHVMDVASVVLMVKDIIVLRVIIMIYARFVEKRT